MIIQPFEIVAGDYGQQLDFVVVDGQGNAVDLSSASVNLRVQAANDPTQTNIMIGGNPLTVDNGPAGTCHYTVASGDFSTLGKYLAQLVVSSGGSYVITAPGIIIQVQPSLPQENN